MAQEQTAADNTAASARRPFGMEDVAMLGVVLVWGMNFPIVKYALNEMRPLTFNGLRFLLSSLLTTALVLLIYRELRVRRRDLPMLFLTGLIGNTFYQILFIKGLALTRAGNSSLLVATNPIFIALLSAALGMERVTRRMWSGILLSFVGIGIVIAYSGKGLGVQSSTLLGDGLTLLAAICWAVYAVLSRPLLRRYAPAQLSALTMLLGTPFILLAAIPDLRAQDWGAISWRGWAGLAYSFILSISGAYILYYQAVRAMGNARTAVYGNLVPVVAVVVAAVALGERIAPLQLVGAAVVLLGIYLARSGRRAT